MKLGIVQSVCPVLIDIVSGLETHLVKDAEGANFRFHDSHPGAIYIFNRGHLRRSYHNKHCNSYRHRNYSEEKSVGNQTYPIG